jgi:hypothetical protein
MDHSHFRALAAAGLVAAFAPAAGAQTQEPLGTLQPLGVSFSAEALRDLPSGSTIFSLLDSSVPELISDRVDAGGLTVGQPARIGAHGSSWTQTMYRIGEADVSDPNGGGTPLVVPGILGWQRMDVTTGAMGVDTNAPGPAVTLVPLRPGNVWTRAVEFGAAPSFLLSRTETTNPPAIARLDGWNSASFIASGPLKAERLGMVLVGSTTNSSHFHRADPSALTDRLHSVMTHVVFTPTARDELRFIGLVQGARSPFEHRLAFGQPAASQRATSVHVQSVWERPWNERSLWTGFASYTARRRSTDLEPVSAIVTERLVDGPVPTLLAHFGTERSWSIGGKLTPLAAGQRHSWQGGFTISGGSSSGRPPFGVRIGELVDGLPSRVWDYRVPGVNAEWHQLAFSIFAGDTVAVHPRVRIDGGLRFEYVHGAGTNPQGVSWHDVYPMAGLRWELLDFKRIATLVRFNRYGHRLPLANFAYGDALTATADVYRWNTTRDDLDVDEIGPLVSRFGPGSAGDPGFSAFDPHVSRPYVNELTFGFESRPSDRTLLRMIGIVRHEGQLMGLVNTGVPVTAYDPVTFVDPGDDHAGGETVVAFNRQTEAFGADQYLLTNPAGHHATFAAVDMSGYTTMNRLTFSAGVTAGRSEMTSANRGFLASENDHGLIGEVFANPNAWTNARGRPFTERGYTIKLASTYRYSDKVRYAVAARYQDGQHFARLLIVPGLNQGVEAIRAFVNGKTRFTYTLTVDGRMQKDFTVDGRRLTAVIDIYNILNTRTEIEEFAVTGPLSREISAVQPPRSVRLGLRLAF